MLRDEDILDACRKAGHKSRCRLYDPVVTVLHYLLQAVGREKSFAATWQEMLAKAVCLLDLPDTTFSSSALCQARSRLPLEALQTPVDLVGRPSAQPFYRWKGHRLLALDATTAPMPANKDLFDFFGRAGARATFMRYPIGTLATLLDIAGCMIVDYRFGPYDRGEVRTAGPLLERLREKDLLMADRHFSGAPFLIAVSLRGADFLVRKHACLKVANLPVRKRLGTSDFITEIRISKCLLKQYHGLTEKLEVRAFRATWLTPEGRKLTEWFVTSLKDPVKFKKAALARLYHLRWKQETSYLEFKQFFHSDILRSKTVGNVNKEMAAHVLGYQLVGRLIVEAAGEHAVRPTQVSVAAATRCVLAASSRMSVAPAERLPWMYRNLLRQISQCLIDVRPGRTEPRMLTRDQNHYSRLKISRAQWRQRNLQVPA